MRAETFLSMYRVLEGILERKYTAENKRPSSVVMEYLSDPESLPVRADLDNYREIRNLLTHNAGSDGKPLVEPSQEVLDGLYGVIAYVQKPQPALGSATPADKIMCASKNDRALELMRRMEKNGYSHAPVMDGDRMIGVFSVGTVFAYTADGKTIGPDTRLKEFGGLLEVESDRSARFMFMDPNSSYMDVRAAFERRTNKNSRLVAVFITSNGAEDGKLMGMLTPWDVLRDMSL